MSKSSRKLVWGSSLVCVAVAATPACMTTEPTGGAVEEGAELIVEPVERFRFPVSATTQQVLAADEWTLEVVKAGHYRIEAHDEYGILAAGYEITRVGNWNLIQETTGAHPTQFYFRDYPEDIYDFAAFPNWASVEAMGYAIEDLASLAEHDLEASGQVVAFRCWSLGCSFGFIGVVFGAAATGTTCGTALGTAGATLAPCLGAAAALMGGAGAYERACGGSC